MKTARRLAPLFVIPILACTTGKLVVGTEEDGGSPDSGSSEAATPDSSSSEAATPPSGCCAASDGGSCTFDEVCALHETPVPPPTTPSELVQSMTGDWALCGTTSVFGTHEAGLSFVADGTWYKLYAQNGQLVRGQGFGEQGTWEIEDSGGGGAVGLPVNVDIAGGGGIGLFPAFATNPRKMRLDNNGVFVADYVFATCP